LTALPTDEGAGSTVSNPWNDGESLRRNPRRRPIRSGELNRQPTLGSHHADARQQNPFRREVACNTLSTVARSFPRRDTPVCHEPRKEETERWLPYRLAPAVSGLLSSFRAVPRTQREPEGLPPGCFVFCSCLGDRWRSTRPAAILARTSEQQRQRQRPRSGKTVAASGCSRDLSRRSECGPESITTQRASFNDGR